jgi:hypothetical protein
MGMILALKPPQPRLFAHRLRRDDVAAEHHDVEAIARRGTAIEMDGWH